MPVLDATTILTSHRGADLSHSLHLRKVGIDEEPALLIQRAGCRFPMHAVHNPLWIMQFSFAPSELLRHGAY